MGRYIVAALATIALGLPLAYGAQFPGAAQPAARVKNIVLVHGAFADGSSWSKVIPLLQAKGFNVVAVQIPLTSLKDDVAATKRAIDDQNGPVLLVGHSWAGVVISQVGTDPKVAGLVYAAAGAPNVGQSFGDMGKGYPVPPGVKQIKADAAGFLSLPAAAVAEDFAQDLPRSQTAIMAATQGPVNAASLGTKITIAAWKTKPSWYIVAKNDRMIDPNLERALARKIKATTIELDSSHVVMLAQPQKVAAFIERAASKL